MSKRYPFSSDDLQPAALIRHGDSWGIAFVLGENLSPDWRSGAILVFWDNGEHSSLPAFDDEAYAVVHTDLWQLLKAHPTNQTATPCAEQRESRHPYDL